MAEFTPITTQEQLDKVIGERIAGVKAKYEGFDGYKEKAEDYDALKEKSDGFEQQIAALNKEINGDGEKNLGYKKQLEEMGLSQTNPLWLYLVKQMMRHLNL